MQHRWVLLGVVADECTVDVLERTKLVSQSVFVSVLFKGLGFRVLGIQIHIKAYNNLRPKDCLVAASRRRAHQWGPTRTLQAGQMLPQRLSIKGIEQDLWTSFCL